MQAAVSEPISIAANPATFSNNLSVYDPQLSSDALVLSSTLDNNSRGGDNVDLNFNDLYKSLTIASRQIVDRLNEILKGKLPDGLQSLKAEEVTPEATSDNVVKGVTAFFSAFEKQNPDLSPEELVAKFIEEAKKGVEQGYSDAKQILGDLGALEIDGVESGISKTREMIMTKLDKFAELKLEELTGKSSTAIQTEEITKTLLVQQGGGGFLNMAA